MAIYFNGEIKENTPRNIFLKLSTFETWGKKPIVEDRHLIVNSYANSWLIRPSDVDNLENYELIIEFWPQRFMYMGIIISLLTLFASILFLVIRKNKEPLE